MVVWSLFVRADRAMSVLPAMNLTTFRRPDLTRSSAPANFRQLAGEDSDSK